MRHKKYALLHLAHTKFVPYTANTISNAETLHVELEKIRREGIAFEDQELVLRRCCMAAPIRNLSGRVIASVSFSMSRERFEDEREQLVEELQLLSETISASLGYHVIGHMTGV